MALDGRTRLALLVSAAVGALWLVFLAAGAAGGGRRGLAGLAALPAGALTPGVRTRLAALSAELRALAGELDAAAGVGPGPGTAPADLAYVNPRRCGASPSEPFLASDKVAVLVETRMHPRLLPVLANFLAVLPLDWRLQLFLSDANAPAVEAAPGLKHWLRRGKIRLERLGDVFTDPHYRSSYNAVMKNATFWRAVDGEHVLVFQTDAALCRASAKSVEDYLDWAFVGAPWNEGAKCGNGGLSLRKRSAMLDVLLRPDGPAATNEDEHFCARLRHFGYPMPDFETGRSFSIEMAYYPSPVGLHQVFYHHRIGTDWLYEIHRGCPESRVISTPPCRRTACGNDAKVKAAMNRTAVCEAPFKEARKDRRARDRPVECDITAGFVQPKKGP